jgi:hypothetical protein
MGYNARVMEFYCKIGHIRKNTVTEAKGIYYNKENIYDQD